MYLTAEDYSSFEDLLRDKVPAENLDKAVQTLLRVNESFGFSYRHTPIMDVLEKVSANISCEAQTLRYPSRYTHEYFFMVPPLSIKIPHSQDITDERVLSNLRGETCNLYYWSYDLVSLLIKFYEKASPVSFYAIPANRLYCVYRLHQYDLLDVGSNKEVFDGKFDTEKYDIEYGGAILTDCIPAGAVPYSLGAPLYTYLICILGLCYGSNNDWTSFYEMYQYAVENTVPSFGIKTHDISRFFKDAAYNLLPYSFPVSKTYQSNISCETKGRERLPYLQEAYRQFGDCYCVNKLFRNAVMDYSYTLADLTSSYQTVDKETFCDLLGLRCLGKEN